MRSQDQTRRGMELADLAERRQQHLLVGPPGGAGHEEGAAGQEGRPPAGGLVAGVGDKNTGRKASGLGNIASTVGGIASIFSSDRRLKHNIRKVGEFADGLGIYFFSYLGSKQRFKGVMADEVAELRPWALGPRIAGYATVNYGAL